MSELQTALLIIGFLMIVAVYAYGWWQQKKYRKKFTAAFQTTQSDALYQNSSNHLVEQTQLAGLADILDMPVDGPSSTSTLDEACDYLSTHTDFIIELHLNEPSPSAVLNGLWIRKFDFGKPVQVCGSALTGQHWERAIAESKALYQRFRIALQLVDRNGPISAAKLADFRDLVLGISKHLTTNITVADLEATHHSAIKLDQFCAQVDQLVGVNLVAQDDGSISGKDIDLAVQSHGLVLASDGAYHFLDTQGLTLFSLINRNAQPFLQRNMETMISQGITLLLDVPRVGDPTLKFDQMVKIAYELASMLRLNLVDDHLVTLSDQGLAHIRVQISEVEMKMIAQGISPGSGNARRLFS